MKPLAHHLRHLERQNVREVVFQSGRPIYAKIGGQFTQVTSEPLTVSHLCELWLDTPVADLIRAGSSGKSRHSLFVAGANYTVVLNHRGAKVQIRVLQATPPAPLRRTARTTTAEPAPTRVPAGAGVITQGAGIGAIAEIPNSMPGSLVAARAAGASDVHFASDRPPARRVDGRLRSEGEAVPDCVLREYTDRVLPPGAKMKLRAQGYANFVATVEGSGRVRGHVCRQGAGLKLCFRFLADKASTIEELGLPDYLGRAAGFSRGLVVVSGPLGHGKTTTLAALVELISRDRAARIITIEAPVEVVYRPGRSLISQREVGVHTESFEAGLRAALHEDPDVVAIGELAGPEVIELALRLAESGHLVVATMCAPSGTSTIERLIDTALPDRRQHIRARVAACLKMVVHQRLVPRADREGRVPAVELISADSVVGRLIRDDRLAELGAAMEAGPEAGPEAGMIRLDDSLVELYRTDEITEETARYFCDDPRIIGEAVRAEFAATAPSGRAGETDPPEAIAAQDA